MANNELSRDEPMADRGWLGAAIGSVGTSGGFEVGRGIFRTTSKKCVGNYIAVNKVLSTADPPPSGASSLTSACLLMLFMSWTRMINYVRGYSDYGLTENSPVAQSLSFLKMPTRRINSTETVCP